MVLLDIGRDHCGPLFTVVLFHLNPQTQNNDRNRDLFNVMKFSMKYLPVYYDQNVIITRGCNVCNVPIHVQCTCMFVIHDRIAFVIKDHSASRG